MEDELKIKLEYYINNTQESNICCYNLVQGDYFTIGCQKVPDRKTLIFHIYSLDGIKIGQIKWFGRWRKYCLYPEGDTVWDNKCLSQIIEFMNQLNLVWRSISNERQDNNT